MIGNLIVKVDRAWFQQEKEDVQIVLMRVCNDESRAKVKARWTEWWQQFQKKEKAAVASAEKWLGIVDQEKYGESWKGATEFLRNAVKQDQWGQSMQAVRNPLGKLVSRKVKSTSYKTSLPDVPDGEYVVIEFETSFENMKSAVETVTSMMDKDGKWQVSGYFIK